MLKEQLFTDIYNYTSFNLFLNDWVEQRRKNGRFSLGVLVKELQLIKISEIANILKGRRSISHKLLEKFVNTYPLSEEEKYYLKLIAEIDRNRENQILKNVLIKEVQRITNKKLVSTTL